MEKENHIFQGLRRDNHQIRQKPEFLWDAFNIRITNRDDSTLFSITNEKGTSPSLVSFPKSKYVGHCVLGSYLIVFTEENDTCTIYRIEKKEDAFNTVILFRSSNKLWSVDNHIQALGSYETDLVQKVYWVDGEHQPRVINITLPELKKIEFKEGEDITEKLGLKDTSFDFVQTLKLEEEVTVTKQYGNGMFAPGVIQYAFTYYNKYGQESNIFYTTPLHYISYKDRGGKEDEKIANSFRIELSNLDDFAFVRVYSIHRTSLSSVPTVKLVEDVEIKDRKAVLIDTGTKGSIEDNNKLLYIGGRNIVAGTMAQKDNTLFLGNIKYGNNFSDKVREILESCKYEFKELELDSYDKPIHSNTYYDYDPSVDMYDARFKYGETYRCGIQAQLSDGTWTDPVFMGDKILNDKVRWNISNTVSSKKITIVDRDTTLNNLKKFGVRKLRACVVFPNLNDREVICQGVLSPTVYFKKDRETGNIFNLSSWYFRPITDKNEEDNIRLGSIISYNHGQDLSSKGIKELPFLLSKAYVDENAVTFHSPDIEFDSEIQNLDWSDTYVRILGVASLGAISGDISIETKTPSYALKGGVNTVMQGYTTGMDTGINGGLVWGMFYKDLLVPNDFSLPEGNDFKYFPVFTWHRSGSLNNDTVRPSDKGERTAVLKKKVISNLKFFDTNKTVIPVTGADSYDITVPQLFMSDELSLIKFQPVYSKQDVGYMGNVDKVITESDYLLYMSDMEEEDKITLDSENLVDSDKYIAVGNDPIRMKYKSTPHLMFSLKGDENEWPVLPRISNDITSRYKVEYNPGKGTTIDYKVEKYSKKDIYKTVNFICIGNADIDDFPFIPEEFLLLNYIKTGWTVVSGINDPRWYFMESVDDGKFAFTSTRGNESYILKIDKFTTIVNYKSGDIAQVKGPFKDIFKDSDFAANGKYIGDVKYIRVYFNPDIPELGATSMVDVTELVSEEDDEVYYMTRDYFSMENYEGKPYLWIAEICRKQVLNRFGGNTEEARKANIWFPAGDPVDLNDEDMSVPFMYGDTWYQRYDCLKTYPFTNEDENQVVEIGSFMCETRVNINGRTDRNRGKYSNLDMTPLNFNLFNEVYNQKDSFFNYRILDKDFYKSNRYANQVTWTLEKSAGAVTDNWTNITLANILDMDGSKGEVTSLNVWNDNLLCLQERQFSQILFNSRVQIPVSDGVPIEIGNGQKVEGTRTISDSVGCKSKFSTLTTSNGFYFLDKNTDGLYLFNGQLNNITDTTGMSWWTKRYHDFDVRLFNDRTYNDVYLVTDDIALCFSEKLGQFTSQMSYGGVSSMFNIEDRFYSFKDGNLYRNNDGKYNDFYGTPEPWYISFISNDRPIETKIFDTVDLRMDCFKGELLTDSPINFIHVDNEYQTADSIIPNETSFRNKNMMRKFRIWRGLIPRNNGTRQRIRNPWAMIRLGYNPIGNTDNNDIKSIIHDVSVNYSL